MPPLGASQATAEHPRPSSHVNRISEQDQAELDKLDRAVARMRKSTLSDPYLITIAQDRHLKYQYQWRSQQYQWLHGPQFDIRSHLEWTIRAVLGPESLG